MITNGWFCSFTRFVWRGRRGHPPLYPHLASDQGDLQGALVVAGLGELPFTDESSSERVPADTAGVRPDLVGNPSRERVAVAAVQAVEAGGASQAQRFAQTDIGDSYPDRRIAPAGAIPGKPSEDFPQASP